MVWGKSTEGMIERFERLLPADPRVERRTMFGCPMGFANGNIFFGLHENRFLIRVGDGDRATLIEEFKAKAFEPMPGRTSSATLVVPDRIAADPAALRSWFAKALSYALSLPPKKAKKKNAPPRKTAQGKPRRSKARKG